MTLSTAPAKEIKLGNDVTTVFSFTFVIKTADDMNVIHTDSSGVETTITEGTGTANYSIAVGNYPGNGSITYPATLGTELATGATLTLARVVDLDQETDLQNQAQYKPETVEATFDYGRMIDLQQQEQIDRSIKAPISDNSGADYTLPTPVADTVIGIWNPAGTAIIEGPTAAEISGASGSATAAAGSATASAASAAAALVSENNSATSESNAAASAAAAAAAVNGIGWKSPARAATTADITLSGTQTVDGIALIADDRCLVKDQTAPAENGIYVVAAGAWSRSEDADTWDELVSASVNVEEGTAADNQTFICTSNAGGTLETTSVTWQLQAVTGGGGITVSDGVSGGQTLSISNLRSIWIPANLWNPNVTNGAAALATIENGSSSQFAPNITTMDFGSSEHAQTGFAMPDNWDGNAVQARVYWSHASTTTNFDVQWGFTTEGFINDESMNGTPLSGTATPTDTGGTTNNLYITDKSTAFLLAGATGSNPFVVLGLGRNGGALAVDARMHGVMLYYTIDTLDEA